MKKSERVKKSALFFFLFLLCTMLFAENKNDVWQLKESPHENYLYYTIVSAPSEYKSVIGTRVYLSLSEYSYKNLYNESCKEKLLEFLNDGKFKIMQVHGSDCIFIDSSFINQDEIKFSKEQLNYIWKTMSLKYAGFSAMKKKGFSKIALLSCHNASDLTRLFDKCIEDCHFSLFAGDYYYRQNPAKDEGTTKSIDSPGTYFEKETSNAYYVRFTDCMGDVYFAKFWASAYSALNKDFFILDARSNNGGSDAPQFSLIKVLNTNKYAGIVIILQDNWSYSSGELWHVFGRSKLLFDCKLVGTHSGGMQNYGNCQTYENKDLGVSLYFGSTDFSKDLPSNYLGDGKGYVPDIWATTETMKSVLEEMGVDTGDIIFQ